MVFKEYVHNVAILGLCLGIFDLACNVGQRLVCFYLSKPVLVIPVGMSRIRVESLLSFEPAFPDLVVLIGGLWSFSSHRKCCFMGKYERWSPSMPHKVGKDITLFVIRGAAYHKVEGHFFSWKAAMEEDGGIMTMMQSQTKVWVYDHTMMARSMPVTLHFSWRYSEWTYAITDNWIYKHVFYCCGRLGVRARFMLLLALSKWYATTAALTFCHTTFFHSEK